MMKHTKTITIVNYEDIEKAVGYFIEGKLLLVGMGSVFAFMYNPEFIDLADSLNTLKGREKNQYLSLICTYDKACKFADKTKINSDFYNVSSDFCYKVPSRILIDASLPVPFSYNTTQNSIQFMSFESSGTLLGQFQNRLREMGYEYISGTSGNFHGQPTVHDLASAQKLAAEFSEKANELNMDEIEVIVIDFPSNATECMAAFPIVSFCNKDAIEIKRLLNKQDKEKTQEIIDKAFQPYEIVMPIIYVLE